MLWHPKEELEALGPPRRKDLIWAAIAFVILPFVILYQISSIIRAVRDDFIVISKTLAISATAASEPIKFGAGIAIHVVVLAFLFTMLWAASLWFSTGSTTVEGDAGRRSSLSGMAALGRKLPLAF